MGWWMGGALSLGAQGRQPGLFLPMTVGADPSSPVHVLLESWVQNGIRRRKVEARILCPTALRFSASYPFLFFFLPSTSVV